MYNYLPKIERLFVYICPSIYKKYIIIGLRDKMGNILKNKSELSFG